MHGENAFLAVFVHQRTITLANQVV